MVISSDFNDQNIGNMPYQNDIEIKEVADYGCLFMCLLATAHVYDKDKIAEIYNKAKANYVLHDKCYVNSWDKILEYAGSTYRFYRRFNTREELDRGIFDSKIKNSLCIVQHDTSKSALRHFTLNKLGKIDGQSLATALIYEPWDYNKVNVLRMNQIRFDVLLK